MAYKILSLKWRPAKFSEIVGQDHISKALSTNFSSSSLDAIKISSSEMNSDIHASAEYRAHIIKVMAKKAVSSC
mgnify:CR=1 FL=1